MNDNVNSPQHYTVGGIETIDYIKAKLSPEQYEGYLAGNVMKYTSRFQHKNGKEDLQKADWYMQRLMEQRDAAASALGAIAMVSKAPALPPQQQQPRPEHHFKVGDRVRWKKHDTFFNGKYVVTIEEVNEKGTIRFAETGTTLSCYSAKDLVLDVPAFKKGDRVRKKDGSPFSFTKGVSVLTVHRVEDGQVGYEEVIGYCTPVEFLELAPPAAPKSINDLCKEAYNNAVLKGWYEEKRTFGEVIALMHSELSEALEDYRTGKSFLQVWNEPDGKPCGILSELADVVIRVFDACGSVGADLEGMIAEKMAYNATRPQRHGGKKL